MGSFAAIKPQFQPARWGGGFHLKGTEGASWGWVWPAVTNPDGSIVDMLTGITGTCQIFNSIGGGVLVTLTYTGHTDGTWGLSCDESLTGGLAVGADQYTNARTLPWGFTLFDGTDLLQVWSPANSTFRILKAA